MNVSTLVLLGLAGVWAVVLAPEVIKRSSALRNNDSVTAFRRQLSSIGRHTGSATSAPSFGNVVDLGERRTAASAPVRKAVHPSMRKRRQEILVSLAAVAVLTLLCTVAFGGAFIWLHLIADVLLVGYVYLLVQSTNAAAARPARARSGRPVSSARPSTSSLSSALMSSPVIRSSSPLDEPGLAIGRVTPIAARRVAN
jgi:hypothetical protein